MRHFAALRLPPRRLTSFTRFSIRPRQDADRTPLIAASLSANGDDAMDDLLVDFLTETNESLAELDVALVRLEQMPDDDATLSQIFRLVHTIKGTCGFLGLPRLERVAHAGGERARAACATRSCSVTPDIVTSSCPPSTGSSRS